MIDSTNNRQRVTILGSTGTIGVNTLDVIRRNPGRFSILALTANNNVDDLLQQCLEFQPQFAVLGDPASADRLSALLATRLPACKVLSGAQGLCQVASEASVDVVMAGIVGAAGLESSLAAAAQGKRLLLANKESLVMSGALFMETVEQHGATLLPIDSEHNAIYQCLANGATAFAGGVRKIFLTASGGPLLRTNPSELGAVTPDQACAHPNWRMGRKISVDSATMMNKGLELIEARWLFRVPVEAIEIVIHPQQTIHSMVEYEDGSMVAQMGNPDMRTPIAHGLAWPDRIDSGVDGLDLLKMGQFDFEPLDRNRFPCVALAEAAATGAPSLSIALNAANEIAVDGFLRELIRFTDIPIVVESVLNQTTDSAAPTLDDIVAIDAESRQRAHAEVGNRRKAG